MTLETLHQYALTLNPDKIKVGQMSVQWLKDGNNWEAWPGGVFHADTGFVPNVKVFCNGGYVGTGWDMAGVKMWVEHGGVENYLVKLTK